MLKMLQDGSKQSKVLGECAGLHVLLIMPQEQREQRCTAQHTLAAVDPKVLRQWQIAWRSREVMLLVLS
jgi:hypothetical protein